MSPACTPPSLTVCASCFKNVGMPQPSGPVTTTTSFASTARTASFSWSACVGVCEAHACTLSQHTQRQQRTGVAHKRFGFGRPLEQRQCAGVNSGLQLVQERFLWVTQLLFVLPALHLAITVAILCRRGGACSGEEKAANGEIRSSHPHTSIFFKNFLLRVDSNEDVVAALNMSSSVRNTSAVSQTGVQDKAVRNRLPRGGAMLTGTHGSQNWQLHQTGPCPKGTGRGL